MCNSYYPMKIGNYVSIGDGCIIEAASIGEGVVIGKNCIIVRLTCLLRCWQCHMLATYE